MRLIYSLFLFYFFIGQPISIAQTLNDTPTTDRLATLYKIITDAGWGDNPDNEERTALYTQVADLMKQDTESIAELEENARAMKEKEQSTTNKLLGATAIATAGHGIT